MLYEAAPRPVHTYVVHLVLIQTRHDIKYYDRSQISKLGPHS